MNLLDYVVHKRVQKGFDVTNLIQTYNPQTEYTIRVRDYDAPIEHSDWIFKIPLALPLENVNSEIKQFFSPNEEHYSVTIISCKDDEKLLRSLCGALGA